MHLYVPIAPHYSYEQVAQFAELVARHAMKEHPHLSTLERSLKKRMGGLIYLDHLQNARGKSVVAPYSVRAEAGATVSTPLTWAEVERPLSPGDFTIATLPQRLTQQGDLFAPVLTQKQELGEAIERLEDFFRRSHSSVKGRAALPRTIKEEPMAKKSSSSSSKGKSKIHKVMKEHKEGTLKSSSGKKVKSRKQAVAIALSEARQAGATIPKKKS
jgi:hypothetical protein